MALTPDWWAHHRDRMSRWHKDDLGQIRSDLATMQREIDELEAEAELAEQHDTTPATITLTVS